MGIDRSARDSPFKPEGGGFDPHQSPAVLVEVRIATGRCGYVSKTQLLADTRLWACAYLSGARQIGATNNLLTHRVWSA